MKNLLLSLTFVAALHMAAPAGHAQVEYVKVCSTYGAGFHYIPGTDVCLNEGTGETRQATQGGLWGGLAPFANRGEWTTIPQVECGLGQLVQVGTYKPTDFKQNAYGKFQAPPFSFKLQPGQFISRVMMSGGFYDPNQPAASSPNLGGGQFCLRVADPNYTPVDMGTPSTYPFCSVTPLACFSDLELVGTPAAYSISVLGAPVVHYNTNSNGNVTGPPQTCGSQLVVTTGTGNYDPTVIYESPNTNPIATAGTLKVWACVQSTGGFLVP